jgi:polysaccharide deacetylase family protein (PEP-CTERM system associated)
VTVWNALTVDVEDWFHIMEISDGPRLEEWTSFEGRVERNTAALLDLLSGFGVVGSFFPLGWVAERYPHLIEEIRRRGHELGSHGYAHVPVFRQTREEFRRDVARSIEVIEGIAGVKPAGYRAPGFSLVTKVPWSFDVIAELGFRYDSSLVPGFRFHGGWIGSPIFPHRIHMGDGRELSEFPISTLGVGRRRIPFLGGGYLRIFPLRISLRALASLNKRGLPGMLYVHPRDLDPLQPRLGMPLSRRLASYTGLRSCLWKLRSLLTQFRFTTVTNALESYFAQFPARVWRPNEEWQ